MTTLIEAGAADAVEAAVAALRSGDIIGIPTDTVYGLAADPWHSGATDRLFFLKGRPRHVELPVFVSGPEQAREVAAAVPVAAERLMAAFWPGPLTIVLPRGPEVNADLGDDDATIGVRAPDHPMPLALCEAFGPYATTSANRHGQEPLTEAAAVAKHLPGVELVIDGGPCRGEPSTVVDATGEVLKLLRSGSLDWDLILQVASSP